MSRRAARLTELGIPPLNVKVGFIGNWAYSGILSAVLGGLLLNNDEAAASATVSGALTEWRYSSPQAASGLYFYIGLWSGGIWTVEQKFGPYTVASGMNVFTIAASLTPSNSRHLAVYIPANVLMGGIGSAGDSSYQVVSQVPNVTDTFSAGTAWVGKKASISGWG